MEVVKKITLKKCCGNLKAIVRDRMKAGETLPVLRVIGQVTNASIETSDLGEYVRLRGQFKAINLLDQSEYTSAACILPDVASYPVYHQMQVPGDDGQTPKVLEFAYDMTIKEDESSAVGYEHGCTPLIETTQDDPLERLSASLPKLPAPPKAKAKSAA